ncbi:MAG: hypothetical protein II857_06705 [Selenomonadaceae bacterium]|nr:hypothetical protein [Selenomonadaceae bacterium]
MKTSAQRLNVLQACLDALQTAQDNTTDALDALEQEFGEGRLDDDIIGCLGNVETELGFAIEELEAIFKRTLEEFHKLNE